MLLEVLLAGADELEGNELEAEAQMLDICPCHCGVAFAMAIERSARVVTYPRVSKREMMGPTSPRWEAY